MPPQVPTSFIPKKPLDTSRTYHESGSIGFFFFIALFVFLVSLVGAGGVFAYNAYTTKSIADKSASLAKAEGAFDLSTVQDLIRMDARMKNAQTLMQSHIAPSAVFAFLSQQTLQKVQFTSFDYTYDTESGGTITMQGIADTFSSVALQSDQFGASKLLKEVVFSNIQTGAGGQVTFAVSAMIDPALINYAKNLGVAAAQPIPPPTPTPATSTTPVAPTR